MQNLFCRWHCAKTVIATANYNQAQTSLSLTSTPADPSADVEREFRHYPVHAQALKKFFERRKYEIVFLIESLLLINKYYEQEKTRKNFSPLIKIKVPGTKKPKTPKRVSPPELRDIDKTAGFTLIEILVVLALIAILAAIVIVAINPARQFKQGRDSQRFSNLNTILDGIDQRIADNKEIFAEQSAAAPKLARI